MSVNPEIENRVLQFRPSRHSSFDLASYVGGKKCPLRYLNLTSPDLRKLSREGYSFSDASFKEQLRIFQEHFLASKVWESKTLALIWLESLYKKDPSDLLPHWNEIAKWANGVSNWGHSDELCGIYAALLEVDRTGRVLRQLQIWNRGKDPWLVRISLVSLYYYSRMRDKFQSPAIAEDFVSRHFDFDHYYVQKAVGWTLREHANAHPARGKKFIFKHVHRISAGAFSASIEKFSAAEKIRIKKLRKLRKKK